MFSLDNASLPILEITFLKLKNYYRKVNSLFMYHISAVTQKNKENKAKKTKQEGGRDVIGRCAFPIYNVCFCLYVCDMLITKMCSINVVIGETLHVSLFVYHYTIRKSFSTHWKSKWIDSHSYSILTQYAVLAIGQKTKSPRLSLKYWQHILYLFL